MFNWKRMPYEDVMKINSHLERGVAALFPFGHWFAEGEEIQPVTLRCCQHIRDILEDYTNMYLRTKDCYLAIEQMYKEMIGTNYLEEFFNRLHLIEDNGWYISAEDYVDSLVHKKAHHD